MEQKHKIILVTGSDSGIGFRTALQLACDGYHVIMHGRNESKVKKAVETVKNTSHNSNVDFIIADLSLMKNIKKMVTTLYQRYNHLDALINNAGSQMGKYRIVTQEGHEKTFAINTLAPLLLSESLLKLLNNSGNGRILTVSSATYKVGNTKYLNDMELKDHYSMARAYALSKLYVLWLMKRLNQNLRSKNSTISVNCMEPASAVSNLGSEDAKDRSFLYKILLILWRPLEKDPRIAGTTNARIVTSKKYQGMTGNLFNYRGKVESVKSKYNSPEGIQKVWNYCMKAIKPYLINK